MIFEQIATGGCQSYLVGCPETCAGVLIDPELRQIDRYRASAARDGGMKAWRDGGFPVEPSGGN